MIEEDSYNIDKLFGFILNHQKDENDYLSLRIIYGEMHKILDNKNYKLCSQIISAVKKHDLNITNSIGFLIITKNYKSEIFNRKDLVKRTIEKIKNKCPEKEEKLMEGLY